MIITLENYRNFPVGSKARNLFLLMEHSCPVPPFFCVPEDFQEEEVLFFLKQHFPDTCLFSVRSCASEEDGTAHSFAGQFQTFLNVSPESVCTCIRQVLSGPDHFATEYCRLHHIDPSSIQFYVIIQEMIEADTSGVLFTANPQGVLNETVIVHGQGTGDRIVEDRTDTVCYYYNLTDQNGYHEQTGSAPLLTKLQFESLIGISQKIRELFHMECDIEYAWKDDRLYLLQVRPVTTLHPDDPVIILDNSNIVESYPGITLPLTQSFIQDAYYHVFRTLLLRLTGREQTVRYMDPVLQHMVDTVNGRVYYRISNWYDVLLLLPFRQKIIPIWQEMMGVGDKTVTSCLPEKIGWCSRFQTALSFFRLLFTCPHEMKRLENYFSDILNQFETLDIASEDNQELLKAYHTLKDKTVARWDITLVNDMYAFLFTGLLKALLKAKQIPNPDLAANQAIRGIRHLDSLKPIQELIRIASQIRKEGRIEELQKLQNNQDYESYVQSRTNDSLTCQTEDYIRRFGDRNTEELKLESKTFRTDPILLIRRLLQYAEDPKPCEDTSAQEDPPLRLSRLSRFLAGKAALGIRNREQSRLNRSRLYGMMRTLVLQMGTNLQREGRIEEREDIFWLYCEEIEQAATEPDLDLQEKIAFRRKEYEGFASLPAYSRLVFSKTVTDRHPGKVQKTLNRQRGKVYMGTACSQGTAEGRVLIVENPALLPDTTDRILVAKMTDPGWVFLIARAGAIIAEKGSLLSHTAIISRELLKPAVVGIPHITEILKDGDLVRVDGNTGTVTILS